MSNIQRISVVVRISDDESDASKSLRAVQSLAWADRRVNFVIVCDGASDQSMMILEKLCRLDTAIGYIQLSRKFGRRASQLAGLKAANGDLVLIAPKVWKLGLPVLQAMVHAAEQGVDIVRSPSTGRAFWSLTHEDLSGPTLLSRRVVEALKTYPETSGSLADMLASIGFSHLRLETDLKTLAPIATVKKSPAIWAVIATAALLTSALVGHTFWANLNVIGWPTTLAIASGLGMVTLLFNAFVLAYVAAVERNVQRRPLYVIKTAINGRSESSLNA